MLIQFTVTEANGGPTMDDLPPEMYTVPVGNVMMPVTAVHVRPFQVPVAFWLPITL
jgi:hypothetical protein